MSPRPSQSDVKQEIEDAFRDVEYPGDDRLVDDTAGDLEAGEIAAVFKGKNWKQVSLGLLLSQSGALAFFTPEAFRFYLPAYLMASLVSYDEADIIPHSVTMSIIAPTEPKDIQLYGHRVQERIHLLTAKQKAAVRSFLSFMRHSHPEDDPLNNLAKAIGNLSES